MADTYKQFVTDGARIYALDHPQIARTLKERLAKRKHELGSAIVYGSAMDWADYKERIGVVKGIDEAIVICDQVEKEER